MQSHPDLAEHTDHGVGSYPHMSYCVQAGQKAGAEAKAAEEAEVRRLTTRLCMHPVVDFIGNSSASTRQEKRLAIAFVRLPAWLPDHAAAMHTKGRVGGQPRLPH
jgi:hypothetical protein